MTPPTRARDVGGGGGAAGYDTISFLSDYGHGDEFVGVVHSVIAAIAPHARVVDITHGIAPHDVRAGGLALARAAQYLMPGVVLAVVDPGVGTDRRPVAVEVGDGASVLVGPDNGLLAPAVALVGGASRAVKLTSPQHRLAVDASTGATFDGRDVFGPAAAHLCCGVRLSDLGEAVDPASLMPGVLPVSRIEGDDLVAEVLWIDRFGNCQLNLGPEDLAGLDPTLQVVLDDDLRTAELARAYDDIKPGRVGLLTDSAGLVSLALPRRSAAEELGLREGTEVRLRAVGASEEPSARRGTVTSVGLTRRVPHVDQGGQP